MKKKLQKLLDYADIKIDGNRKWDIQVENQDFYPRVFAESSLALGETYMEKWWECEAIDQFVDRVLKAKLETKIKTSKGILWNTLKAKIINQQRKSKAYLIGRTHYDLGNNLYKNMLDERMNYSCGYWENAKTLDEAQENKLELICEKIDLKPEMKVLDIGCGWGSFAKYTTQEYKAKVTGITVSKKQAKFANTLCEELDVEIKLEDYRDLNEKFDRIISIGMFEHVGYKNYKKFFKVVDRCLEEDGIFLLHTIGRNKSSGGIDPWIDKYIFQNSFLPSANQITKSYEGIFRLEDWHSFGTHYDKTLMEWHKNFNKNWNRIEKDYDENFKRMWNYYLLSCAGSFRAHKNQLWQIVFSKIDSQIDYKSVR
jgi:cyclopropane-fatty-acyl-phospholipid synthase